MEISYNVLQRNSVNSYLKEIFAYNVGEIITGLVFTQNAGKLISFSLGSHIAFSSLLQGIPSPSAVPTTGHQGLLRVG